jgi:hypothetical protein
MKTTLNKIKSYNPCNQSGPPEDGGWQKLLQFLGKTESDDEELSIATILESNGIEDAVWALRAVGGHDREIRLFACECADSALHIFEKKYPNDDRPRRAIEVARRFANGEANVYELDAAWDAARDAAYDAAAWSAARTAAWSAAWAATAWAARAARAAAGAARAAAGDAMDEAGDAQKSILIKYI